MDLLNSVANKVVEYGQGVVMYPATALARMDIENKGQVKRAMKVGSRAPSAWLWASAKNGGMGLESMVKAQDRNLTATVVAIVVNSPDSLGKRVILNNLRLYGDPTRQRVTTPGGAAAMPPDPKMPTTGAVLGALSRLNLEIIVEEEAQLEGHSIPTSNGASRADTALWRSEVMRRKLAGLQLQLVPTAQDTNEETSTSQWARNLAASLPPPMPAARWSNNHLATGTHAATPELMDRSHDIVIEETTGGLVPTCGIKSLVVEGPHGASSYHDDKGQLCCWVDGSKKGDKAGGAVYFGRKNPLNQVFQVTGTQSSFNVELQAVEMALAVAPPESLHIFSDNKAVCGLVGNMTLGHRWITRKPTL